MKYNHIFFDLDHTLWDFDTNAKVALEEVFSQSDLPNKIETFDAFYENYLIHNAQLWRRYEQGFISVEELKWRRMWRTLMDFKIGDEELSKKLAQQFLEILPTKSGVFEYTYEILDFLIDKGYQLHLITNGFEKTQHSKLSNSRMTHYFKNVITSESANASKPKKEIFDFAVHKAGCQTNSCIMIGDNLEADIKGAQNAGMDTIFANHIKRDCDVNPTYIIHHLKELESIF